MAFRDLLHTLDESATTPAQVERSVVAHLNWLLNSRRDRHPQLEGYGLPDLHDYMHSPNPEVALAVELKRVIEKYEPRLTRVRVSPEAGPEGTFVGRLHARFVIEAMLVEEEGRREFHEMAEIDHDGNVDLK